MVLRLRSFDRVAFFKRGMGISRLFSGPRPEVQNFVNPTTIVGYHVLFFIQLNCKNYFNINGFQVFFNDCDLFLQALFCHFIFNADDVNRTAKRVCSRCC